MDTTPEKIQQLLHESLDEGLKNVKSYNQCALLNYPNHYNIGDHLIWLGTIFYLVNVLGVAVNYAASIESFSREELAEKVGQSPIFFLGGGNFGDIWSYYQRFYERILPDYHDRPIIFLPQSIRFRSEERLERAKNIFNNHPDITIFARENRSYEFAKQHFYNCKVFKSPDMALEMINIANWSFLKPTRKDTILYLSRKDGELNRNSSPESIDLPNVVIEDWASYRFKGVPRTLSVPGIAHILQQSWQQGTVIPHEWISRQLWKQFHSYTATFNQLDNPSLHRKSWNFMHNGVYQFLQHRLIITNRLHGHILCILLKIPHLFLANSYHKNESFHETWTYQIPFCRFIQDASQIKPKAEELMDVYL
jgi:pyruvyl transferase EpsO